MLSVVVVVAVFLALAGQAASRGTKRGCGSALSNTASSLTLLYQNNLNLTDDANHIGAILLDAQSSTAVAEAQCSALGETLLTKAAIEAHANDFYLTFNYLTYSGRADPSGHYLIANGTVSGGPSPGQVSFQEASGAGLVYPLPVLCTQSATGNTGDNAVATPANEVHIPAAGNTYVGYRSQKSWRFLGIRYADPPSRWQYSVPYSGKGQVLNATQYGSQCIQPYTNPPGSEDCLFLNIQTPYIPRVGYGAVSNENLRPVVFYIHGGGFTGGSGAADYTDGGQYASREDIVTVNINYRLTTLGFLAVPGTNVAGNYGIQDQNLALKWTVENIASFGGDPNRITINGDSAGAGSVRAHLGSPKSIGLFQGAIAISNLGGGVDLGLSGDYGTTYGSYYTIEQSYAASSALFGEAGCNQTDASAALACLAGVSAETLVNLPTVARYVVQDGTYVNTPELIVSHPTNNTAHVPVMFGDCRDEGASFSTYPHPAVNSTVAGIEAALGINAHYAQAVIDSGLFPNPDTGNITLDAFNISARLATDKTFLCWNQASAYAGATTGAFASAYFFISDRTGNGYDPNNVALAPPAPGFPLGDPDLPYFRVHGSDINAAFGWATLVRDPADQYNVDMMTSYVASFIRSGQPNPPANYLEARGYTTVLEGTQAAGPWGAVESEDGPIQHLDWPGFRADFKDKPQCAWLNYSIDYFLVNGY